MTEIDASLAAGLARRFRLVRQLGAGGMGAVYLAEQIAVGNRPVALKVLLRKLLDDPDFLQRFQNEAASTGRIRHPNVVTIYESGQSDDGTPYIAMEYLEGEPLRQTLKRRGALPVAECAEILQQAARGLNAAHKLGIIHRDLKPDNIFLTHGDESVALASSPAQAVGAPLVGARDVGAGSVPAGDVGAPLVGALPVGADDEHATYHGHPARARAWPGWPWHDEHPANVVVKIVDFGIAKLRESATHTLTGTVLGTPAYMSYEQASGMKSDELDSRSDIYSLGVVTYEMLTGRLPFESDTPVGYLRKHLQDTPPPFRAVKPDLPALPEVESVVMKALTKDRDQRYGSVLEFANAFAEAAEPAPEMVGAVREPPLRDDGTILRATAPPFVPPEPPPQTIKHQATLPPRKPHESRRKWLVVFGCFVILFAIAAACFWFWARSAEWGLPIRLGQTSGEVDQVLGTPNEIVNTTTLQQKRQELGFEAPLTWPVDMEQRWYYSSGLIGVFRAEKLSGITILAICSYPGFVPHSGAIVDTIKLSDSKDQILRKLGRESKIEEDSLEPGTNPEKPAVWPAESRYYWRKTGYTVEVDFLRQAQLLDEKDHLTRPKEAVEAIRVYK